MNKKFWSTLIVAGIGVFVYYQRPVIEKSLTNLDRETIQEKKQNNENNPNRKIASLPPAPTSKIPTTGHLDDKLEEDKRELFGNGPINSYENKYNEEWETLLKNDLANYLAETAKISIKIEKSMLKVQEGKARYVEQVVIKVKNGNERSSYRALIDSETGKVIDTWDRFHLPSDHGIISRL